ncbi:MAG TPA: hypothetical protein DCM87_16695, partial [Planctomycetes bacterium]|nr:hypothetical protein [Planctomycetota bacterium]
GTDVLFQGRTYACLSANFPGGTRYLRLYDFRHRAYSPALGRFLQRDPIGAWGDGVGLWNAYAMEAARPIESSDPMGQRLVLARSRINDNELSKQRELTEINLHNALRVLCPCYAYELDRNDVLQAVLAQTYRNSKGREKGERGDFSSNSKLREWCCCYWKNSRLCNWVEDLLSSAEDIPVYRGTDYSTAGRCDGNTIMVNAQTTDHALLHELGHYRDYNKTPGSEGFTQYGGSLSQGAAGVTNYGAEQVAETYAQDILNGVDRDRSGGLARDDPRRLKAADEELEKAKGLRHVDRCAEVFGKLEKHSSG